MSVIMLTVCLAAVLVVIGGLCFLTPVFHRLFANRIRIFFAIFVLILASAPIVHLIMYNSDTDAAPAAQLPRITPLALSAVFTSNLRTDNDVLLISRHVKNLLDLPDVSYSGILFPSIGKFYLENSRQAGQNDTNSYNYILLDCSSPPFLSLALHYLTSDAVSRLKLRLCDSGSALVVLLPQYEKLANSISSTVSSCFEHVRLLKIENMSLLFATDHPDVSIADLETINDYAIMKLYGDNTLPYSAFSLLLGPYWDVSQLPAGHVSPASPLNPTALRSVMAASSPAIEKLVGFMERYGLYLVCMLLACFMVFRYFVSGSPAAKHVFHDFEMLFLFTSTVFMIQFYLAFSASPAFMSVWPLACVLIFLFHFQLMPGNGEISAYSVRKRIIYLLLFFFGLFLGSRFDQRANYSFWAILAVLPSLRIFRDSCVIAQRDTSSFRTFLRCLAGVVCGLLFCVCCLFCNAGPFMLSIILTLLVCIRMHSLAQYQQHSATE